MYSKPFIGINVDCPTDRAWGAAFQDFLLPRWLEWIAGAGGVPIVVPRLNDGIDQRRVLEHLQGFVLAGQRDLNPPIDSRVVSRRDRCFEAELVRRIAELRLPFLGIGIGAQALNVALGGTLCPVSNRPRGKYHIHPHNPRHLLLTQPGSLLDRAYGSNPRLVPSTHRVAIDQLAVGFAATACCEDGIVEAIESQTDDWFAVGVQFCPEPDASWQPGMRIFEELVDEAMAYGALHARQPVHNASGFSGKPDA